MIIKLQAPVANACRRIAYSLGASTTMYTPKMQMQRRARPDLSPFLKEMNTELSAVAVSGRLAPGNGRGRPGRARAGFTIHTESSMGRGR
jgi:hypothetical protein